MTTGCLDCFDNIHLGVHSGPYPIYCAMFLLPKCRILNSVKELAGVALTIRKLVRRGRKFPLSISGANGKPPFEIKLSCVISQSACAWEIKAWYIYSL
jgi:hypothetical protein